jgi:hypothetical protein
VPQFRRGFSLSVKLSAARRWRLGPKPRSIPFLKSVPLETGLTDLQLTQCGAFRPVSSRSDEAGWSRCKGAAPVGRFCDEHTVMLQGVLLGLAIVGMPSEPKLTSMERLFGREWLAAERGTRRRRAAKKLLASKAT